MHFADKYIIMESITWKISLDEIIQWQFPHFKDEKEQRMMYRASLECLVILNILESIKV